MYDTYAFYNYDTKLQYWTSTYNSNYFIGTLTGLKF